MFKQITRRALSLVLTLAIALTITAVAPLTASAGGTGLILRFIIVDADYFSEDETIKGTTRFILSSDDINGKFGFENESGDKVYIDVNELTVGGNPAMALNTVALTLEYNLADEQITSKFPSVGFYRLVSYPQLTGGYEFAGWFKFMGEEELGFDVSDYLNGTYMLGIKVDNPNVKKSAPSSWAVDRVNVANDLGLATADLSNDYQAATTRTEFCRAAVNFLRKFGYDIDSVSPKLFADTSDKDIGIAAALGVTSGTDTAKNLFSPNNALTREQAAGMLYNVIKVIGADTTKSGVQWTDAKDISSWAKEAADVMYNAKIMGGTSTTALVFSPKTPYTHEQSIVTLLNLWDYVGVDMSAITE